MWAHLVYARGGASVFGIAFVVIVFLIVVALRVTTGKWPRGGIGS